MTLKTFIYVTSLTIVLSACASSPKTSDAPQKLESVANQKTPKTQSLSKRVLKGATKTSVRAVKGAADLTLGSAELAAKATVFGLKTGGEALVDTSVIVAKGTRRTAKGVGETMEHIFKAPAVKDAANPVGNKTLMDAALSPLSDFNLRKRERPEILMRLEAEDLYFVGDSPGCEWLAVRVAELDEVLGNDYDVEEEPESTLKKIGKAGKGAALAGVASAAGTYIPGRGIVRSVSGAKARQKETREIYQKGVARRSYLKGIAATQGCESF